MNEINSWRETIVINGEECEVVATKTGKRAWRASGEYKGKPIQGAAGATSFRQAIEYWKHAAEIEADKI